MAGVTDASRTRKHHFARAARYMRSRRSRPGSRATIGERDPERLAALTVAVADGLALQPAADLAFFDRSGVYDLWLSVIATFLDAERQGGGRGQRR